jgi:hypothetical protein
MAAMKQLVQSFEAKDDKGTVYHLRVYKFVTERGVSDLIEVITASGEPVGGVSKGVYRLLLRDIIVRSDDPKAP